MNIAEVRVHVLEAALSEPFFWAINEARTRGAAVVEITTDTGLSGFGECFGPALRRHGRGLRALPARFRSPGQRADLGDALRPLPRPGPEGRADLGLERRRAREPDRN